MTKTEEKKRNKKARELYLCVCKELKLLPMDGYHKATENRLKYDIHGKFMTVKNRRRKRRALMAMGISRKAARQSVK